MITIVTVNYNAYDFVGLMIESLCMLSQVPYELVVIDNSEHRSRIEADHVHQFFMPKNVGHGKGLNAGVEKAFELFPSNPYLMFLDCDCHFLKAGWENAFVGKMKQYDLVGGKGPPSKPIRPACMFMRRELGRHDWSPTEGYAGNRNTPGGYDTAIKAYFKIMAANHRIGFLDSRRNRYGTANGEEYAIDDVPYVYHHWHGTHLAARQNDFPDTDLHEDKKKLFSRIAWRAV